MRLIANNYTNKQSSCYFLDMRNSTYITRVISISRESEKNVVSTQRLKDHSMFMMDIHKQLHYLLLKKDLLKLSHHNNTGDGHMCLLWDNRHAWSVLNIVCSMAQFLQKKVSLYNSTTLMEWSKAINQPLKLDFGIGIHSGGSLVYENDVFDGNFAYGIVLNSASRVEAFTKNFVNIPILLTNNCLDLLEKQHKKYNVSGKDWSFYRDKIKQVTFHRVDIKDNKNRGHELYTILPSEWKWFIE